MTARWLSYGDLLGRIGICAFFGFTAGISAMHALEAVNAWFAGTPKLMLLEFLALASGMLFQALVVAITLFRLKPVNAAEGLEARFSALAGTFLLLLLPLVPHTPLQIPLLQIAGLVMLFAGSILSVYVISWLGQSFSIMAEARKLVTGGPYAFVRHPLYMTEEIAIIGMLLLNLSLPVLAMTVLHFLLQLRRIHHEEKVLRNAFSEYEAYAAATPMLVPGYKVLTAGNPAS